MDLAFHELQEQVVQLHKEFTSMVDFNRKAGLLISANVYVREAGRVKKILVDIADTVMANGLWNSHCKDCANCKPEQIRGTCELLINGKAEIKLKNSFTACFSYEAREVASGE